MWVYVIVIVLVVLAGWRLTRTNLYRQRSRKGREVGNRELGWGETRAMDDLNQFNQDQSGLHKRSPEQRS